MGCVKMFYHNYVLLCRRKGVTPSRAALEAGLCKATVTKWKQDPTICPSSNVIGKLTRYFGVSVSDLLGDTLNEENCRPELDPEKPEKTRNFEPTPEFLAGESVPFYERFALLCRRKGVTPSRAAVDSGLSKSTVTKWKKDPTARPSGTILAKLTEYFGMSTSDLLGEGVYSDEPRPVTDEDIKFALFGGSEDITQEMYEEVRSFAAFVKNREAARKNG